MATIFYAFASSFTLFTFHIFLHVIHRVNVTIFPHSLATFIN